jgi:hypothetical protein
MEEVEDLNSSIKYGQQLGVKTTNYTFIPLLTFILFIDGVFWSILSQSNIIKKEEEKELVIKFRQYSC